MFTKVNNGIEAFSTGIGDSNLIESKKSYIKAMDAQWPSKRVGFVRKGNIYQERRKKRQS